MFKVWSPTGLTGKKLAFCTIFFFLALRFSLYSPFLFGLFLGASLLFYLAVLVVIVRFGFFLQSKSFSIDGKNYDLRYFIKPLLKSECRKELIAEKTNLPVTTAALFEHKNDAQEKWSYLDIVGTSLIHSRIGNSFHCLVLGEKGDSLPLFINSLFPKATIDVVKLSPKMVEISKKYFIGDTKKIHIYEKNAIEYLSGCKKKYDLIIIDAQDIVHGDSLFINQKFLANLKNALEQSGNIIAHVGSFTEIYPLYMKWKKFFSISIYRDHYSILFSTLDLSLINHSPQVILRSYESALSKRAQLHFLKSLKKNSKILVEIATDSMIPTYYSGDIVTVIKKKFETIKVGDIIVFKKFGQIMPIAHRVVQIRKNGSLQTKGDNNQSQDAFRIKKADYIGLASATSTKKRNGY